MKLKSQKLNDYLKVYVNLKFVIEEPTTNDSSFPIGDVISQNETKGNIDFALSERANILTECLQIVFVCKFIVKGQLNINNALTTIAVLKS